MNFTNLSFNIFRYRMETTLVKNGAQIKKHTNNKSEKNTIKLYYQLRLILV